MTNKFVIEEYIQVDPHIFSKVKFDKVVQSDNGSMIQLSSNKRELLVKAPIAHAARVTQNRGLYQPRKMAEGVDSLVKPYNKPILLNHDAERDPIGRIYDAVYQPIRQDFLSSVVSPEQLGHDETFGIVKILMDMGLLDDRSFKGLGEIYASMRISDQDAIEKFMDERYMNFSTRVSSNMLYDPLNGKPFQLFFDEVDEKKYSQNFPYEGVDGKGDFVVLGDMSYDENSVVSIPADEFAIVDTMEHFSFTDSKKKPEPKIDNRPYVVRGFYETKDKKVKQNSDNIEIPNQGDKNMFIKIVDGSSAEEVYAAMTAKINKYKEDNKISEDLLLSEDSLGELKGGAFCGPNRSFPVTDRVHLDAAYAVLEDSDLSEKVKKQVLGLLNKKKKMFAEDTKEKRTLNDMLDSLSNYSNFDFLPLLDAVLADCKERDFDLKDSQQLSELVAERQDNSKSDSLLAENKQLTEKLTLVDSQLESLEASYKEQLCVTNVLLKVFKDNLKMESLEKAIEDEKEVDVKTLKESCDSLLKDESLFGKIQKYVDGFVQRDDSDKKPVEDPTEGVQDNVSSESWIEKITRTRFNDIKETDGVNAGLSFVQGLVNQGTVPKAFLDLIKEENK